MCTISFGPKVRYKICNKWYFCTFESFTDPDPGRFPEKVFTLEASFVISARRRNFLLGLVSMPNAFGVL